MALTPDGLANAMVAALPAAWQHIKHEAFPGGDTEDAKIMFLAVARGLLTYLETHHADMISSIDLAIPDVAGGPYAVSNVELNTDLF